MTLDIDDTCDIVHGHQQLSLFNAHYDERCFLPIHVYDTDRSRPVAVVLRPGKTPSGVEVRGHLRRLVRRILVTSIFNGFHKDLFDKLVGINGHVFVQAADRNLRDYDATANALRRMPSIALAVPLIDGPAAFSTPFGETGGFVRGIEERDIEVLTGIEGHVKSGTLEGFDTAEGVAIGQRLAEVLGVQVGDQISLLTAKGALTPFGYQPQIKSYTVTAIFQVGMSIFDSTYVFMPLKESQAFFHKDDEVTLIQVFLKQPEAIDTVRNEIDLESKQPMIMTDWRDTNKTFFDAIQVERNVVFIVVSIIVFVAALNIVSSLVMMVKNKGHAIAILRTVGASRGAVMRIFMIAGTSISLAGTAAGVLVGLLLALNGENIRTALNKGLHLNLFPAEIYYLSKLPMLVDFPSVIGIAIATLCLTILATLYPSWRAAELDPVEALRYE